MPVHLRERTLLVLAAIPLIFLTAWNAPLFSQPSAEMHILYEGDLSLSSVSNSISATDAGLDVSTYLTYQSSGSSSTLTYSVYGGNVLSVSKGSNSISVDGYDVYQDGKHFASRGGAGTTIQSDIFTVTPASNALTFSMNLTSLIRNSLTTFIAKSHLSTGLEDVVATGQVHFVFFISGVVGKEGDARFFNLGSLCNCNGTRTSFDVTVETTSRVLDATMGDTPMRKSAPYRVEGQFSSSPYILRNIYISWEIPPTPGLWDVHPWDWVMGAIVGGAITRIAGYMWSKIKHVRAK